MPGHPTPRSRSAREAAYDHVKQRIMTVRLLPGERIDESRIAGDAGVSRTPVREALHQLAAEGLVEIEARGGYTVARLDLAGYRQLAEAHEIVALTVTELLVARGTAEDFAELAEYTREFERVEDTGDAAAIAEANTKLHVREAELAGNSYLTDLAVRVYTHLQRLAYLSFGGAGAGAGDDSTDLREHHERVRRDHRDYLAALERRDLAAARGTALGHAALFRGRVLRYLASHDARGLTLDGLGSPDRYS